MGDIVTLENIATWLLSPLVVVFCFVRALEWRERGAYRGALFLVALGIFLAISTLLRFYTYGGTVAITSEQNPEFIRFLGSEAGYFLRTLLLSFVALISYWPTIKEILHKQ